MGVAKMRQHQKMHGKGVQRYVRWFMRGKAGKYRTYIRAKQGIRSELSNEVEERGLRGGDREMAKRLREILRERPVLALCRYSREFEKLLRKEAEKK